MTRRPATLHASDFVHGEALLVIGGISTPCGIYVGHEQDGPSTPRCVTTRIGDVTTCPCCLSGTRWPTEQRSEPVSASRFSFLADGSVVDGYGGGH